MAWRCLPSERCPLWFHCSTQNIEIQHLSTENEMDSPEKGSFWRQFETENELLIPVNMMER